MRFYRNILVTVFLVAAAPSMSAISIEECYRLVRENYPLIKQYELTEATSMYSFENAAMGYLPRISLSGQAVYQSDVTEFPAAFSDLMKMVGIDMAGMSHDQYKVQLEISQTIWDGGAARQRKEEARAGADVRSGQVEVNLYALRDRVNQLFFGILLIDTRLEQNALLQGQLVRNYEQVRACVEQGTATPADLDAVSVEQLDARQAEAELRMNRKAYLEVLGMLTGMEGLENGTLVRPAGWTSSSAELLRPELSLYASMRKQLDVREKGLDTGIMPRLSLFAQGAYGDPGLNMLKGGFEPYYIAGVRLSWNISGFYTRKNDKRLLDVDRNDIDVQEEAFRLERRMETAQHRRTVERLDTLMKNDDELLRLRENIRKAAEARVEEGTLTVTEMLREVLAEDQARQTKALHEMQRLQALYDMKYVLNH